MKVMIKGVIVRTDDKWIYDWFGIEAVCPSDIDRALVEAAGQDIEVDINSGGGDIFAGSDIYTALRSYKGKVTIRIVGVAASAASVIAMAGYCEMSPTAMIMVHNVQSSAEGDYHAMDKQSDVLKTANQTIAAAYIGKTKMSEKDALEMMDKETWLTAPQAKEKGLIDAVMFDSGVEGVQLAASAFCGSMLPQTVLDKIRNTVKTPTSDEPGFLIPETEKAQAKLKLLNLRRSKINA